MEITMGARFGSAVRWIWRNVTEGLMCMGWAFSGAVPPVAPEYTEQVIPPAEQPSLPALSEEELATWAALVKQLR
jgi:hypothetical protein